MTVQVTTQRCRSALIEKNLQSCAGTRRASASCSSTARTCQASTPGNQSRNSPTVAPLSRFSNRADTGTRVPANVQAPLSLPGRRSTAGHRAQSVMSSPVPPIRPPPFSQLAPLLRRTRPQTLGGNHTPRHPSRPGNPFLSTLPPHQNQMRPPINQPRLPTQRPLQLHRRSPRLRTLQNLVRR